MSDGIREVKRHRLKLSQFDNGQWVMFTRDKWRKWTILATVTDFEVSLWLDLQEALERIKELENDVV